jgi:hypothetical protein
MRLRSKPSVDAQKALWLRARWSNHKLDISKVSISFGLYPLTTAVTSCNLDIHRCTDDTKLLSPSLMMYEAVITSSSLSGILRIAERQRSGDGRGSRKG